MECHLRFMEKCEVAVSIHYKFLISLGFTPRSSPATPPSCCSSRTSASRTPARTRARESTPTTRRWSPSSLYPPSVSAIYDRHKANMYVECNHIYSRDHVGRRCAGAERGDQRGLQDPVRGARVAASHHRLDQGRTHHRNR